MIPVSYQFLVLLTHRQGRSQLSGLPFGIRWTYHSLLSTWVLIYGKCNSQRISSVRCACVVWPFVDFEKCFELTSANVLVRFQAHIITTRLWLQTKSRGATKEFYFSFFLKVLFYFVCDYTNLNIGFTNLHSHHLPSWLFHILSFLFDFCFLVIQRIDSKIQAKNIVDNTLKYDWLSLKMKSTTNTETITYQICLWLMRWLSLEYLNKRIYIQ